MSPDIRPNPSTLTKALLMPANIEKMKSQQGQDKFGSLASRIWDAIADWFSSTDRAEAKQCLFDVINKHGTTDQQEAQFKRLKSLAGGGFEKNLLEIPKGTNDARFPDLKSHHTFVIIIPQPDNKNNRYYGPDEVKTISEEITTQDKNKDENSQPK